MTHSFYVRGNKRFHYVAVPKIDTFFTVIESLRPLQRWFKDGEFVDLKITPQASNFDWDSRSISATRINRKRKVWTCEMRIPLNALSSAKPTLGTQWRLNFYRCDVANHASLAWNPTLTTTFHTPERFGVLEFAE